MYRRPYYSRRRVSNRKRYYKKRYNTTYKKANYAYYKTKQLSNQQELKCFQLLDVAYGSNNATPLVSDLTRVTQGTDVQSRIGNVVNPTSLKLRIDVIGEGTELAGNKLRVVVFIWKGSDTPVAERIIQGSTGQDKINGFKSLQDRFESKFLWDRTYSLNPLYPSKYIKVNCKIPKRYPISYRINSSVQTPYQANGIYVMMFFGAEDPGGTVSVWQLDFDSRLYFKDV